MQAARPFCTWFSRCKAVPLTAVTVEILSQRARGVFMTRQCTCISLNVLSAATEKAATWRVVLPHIKSLLVRLFIPLLGLSHDDLKLWRMHPKE